MRRIKRLLRNGQELAERRLIGGALQAVLWRYRHLYKRGWAEGYLDTVGHPHRQQLVEALVAFDPLASVLEVGCAAGANLVRLRERFPDAELIGLDINARAIQVGREYFADRGDMRVRFLNARVEQMTLLEARSVDVVVADAVLMFITPDRIQSVISGMARVARKGIVLNEYHGGGLEDGHFEGGRWVHDFEALLGKELPEARIQFRKSSFVGGAWDIYGTLIEVHL
jgi:hypothetical protein